VLFDLFGVGKRYLNKEHFVTPKSFEAQYIPCAADKAIFKDTDPDFRVLDIRNNATFNSSLASYHHKTIGGYSPVKMQRYQDLIDRYLVPEIYSIYDVSSVRELYENFPYLKIISMLNGKYVIFQSEYPPIVNPYAMGHCWFVEDFVPAADPDAEIALIGTADLANTAVIGNDFKWAQEAISSISEKGDKSQDSITLGYYAPNELRYSFDISSPRPVIFSEIYYPEGWKAWIEPKGAYGEVRDGHYIPTPEARPVEIFRADWILRGVVLPEGEGELVMRCEPDSYQLGENVSRASSITLLLLLLASVAGMAFTYRKTSK